MIVVDTSVAIKWVSSGEEHSRQARFLLERHKDGREEIVVPYLLFYEVANAFATKSASSQETIRQDLLFLINAGLTVHREEPREIVDAAILAKRYNTSAYDMLYAVIAKAKKAVLITADEKFKAKTKFAYVVLLQEYRV